MLRVEVMTGVGPTGDREPVEIVLGRRHVPIRLVLDRWFGKGYRYFKLLGYDGAIYILRHEEAAGDWEMTFFERTPTAGQELTTWRGHASPEKPRTVC